MTMIDGKDTSIEADQKLKKDGTPFHDTTITYYFAPNDVSVVVHIAGRLHVFGREQLTGYEHVPGLDRKLVRAALESAIEQLDATEPAVGKRVSTQ